MRTPPRETASDRMHRVLAEILWIAERDGPTVAEAADRFGLSPEALLADLELACMIGADSDDFTDMPVEMYVEGERVFVHLHAFDRPLRLTPAEALSLVVAGAALVGTGDAGSGDDHLARALDKVAAVLGIAVGEQVDVDLGVGDTAVFSALQGACDARRAVEIDHIRGETDERVRRVVEPWSLFREQGAWYLAGHCRTATAERVFRLDRVVAARALDEVIDVPSPRPPPSALRAPADAPRLVLDLDPSASWVVENHPVERVERLGGGRLRVTLLVVSRPWAERLLLRLGPAARIVELDADLGDAHPGAEAARRVLTRYGPAEEEG